MKALILMIACLSIALNAGEPDGLVQQTPSAWESAQDSGKDAASQLREQDSVLELEPYIEPAEQALETPGHSPTPSGLPGSRTGSFPWSRCSNESSWQPNRPKHPIRPRKRPRK